MRIAATAVCTALLAACGAFSTEEETAAERCVPTADAGPDQVALVSAAVTLDGRGSGVGADCPPADLTWHWDFRLVPEGSFVSTFSFSDNASATASAPSFVPDVPGDYVVSLVVCDGALCSPEDLAVVSVDPVDAPPVADAGPDLEGSVGERLELDGSGSYDPEGAPLTWRWRLDDVPACSALGPDDVFDRDQPTAQLVPDCPGAYLVELTVQDAAATSAPDFATVFVDDGTSRPVADAGPDTTWPPCHDGPIELKGYGSWDPDGDPLTYAWSLLEAPPGSAADASAFDDPSSPTPTFAWDVPGDYTFTLTVDDGTWPSAPDLVVHTTTDPSTNSPPTANAGQDQSITISSTCVQHGGVWTCPPCPGWTFELDGSGSSDPDGDPLTWSWTDATGELDIVSPDSALTEVTTPDLEVERNGSTRRTFAVQLEVADCAGSATDTVLLTVTCNGE